MNKVITGLLGLSLAITSSVPAYGMWSRLGSRFGSSQIKNFASRFWSPGLKRPIPRSYNTWNSWEKKFYPVAGSSIALAAGLSTATSSMESDCSTLENEKPLEIPSNKWEGDNYLQEVLKLPRGLCVRHEFEIPTCDSQNPHTCSIIAACGLVFANNVREYIRLKNLNNTSALQDAIEHYSGYSPIRDEDTRNMVDMIEELSEKVDLSSERAVDWMLQENYVLLRALCSGPQPESNTACQACAYWILKRRMCLDRELDRRTLKRLHGYDRGTIS